MIGEPKIDERTEQHSLGIRIQTPYRGMLGQVNKQFKTLKKWLNQH